MVRVSFWECLCLLGASQPLHHRPPQVEIVRHSFTSYNIGSVLFSPREYSLFWHIIHWYKNEKITQHLSALQQTRFFALVSMVRGQSVLVPRQWPLPALKKKKERKKRQHTMSTPGPNTCSGFTFCQLHISVYKLSPSALQCHVGVVSSVCFYFAILLHSVLLNTWE